MDEAENPEMTEMLQPIETSGMQHPGLLKSQWRYMEMTGTDLNPIKNASEKFLQMWESVLERKGSF